MREVESDKLAPSTYQRTLGRAEMEAVGACSDAPGCCHTPDSHLHADGRGDRDGPAAAAAAAVAAASASGGETATDNIVMWKPATRRATGRIRPLLRWQERRVYAAASVVYEERLVPHRGGVREERGRLYAGEGRLPIGGGTSMLKCQSRTPHGRSLPGRLSFPSQKCWCNMCLGFFQPQPSLPTNIVGLNGNTGL